MILTILEKWDLFLFYTLRDEGFDLSLDLVNFYSSYASSTFEAILEGINLENDTVNEIVEPYLYLIRGLLRLRLFWMRRPPRALPLSISLDNFWLNLVFNWFDIATYFFPALKKLLIGVDHDFAEWVRIILNQGIFWMVKYLR